MIRSLRFLFFIFAQKPGKKKRTLCKGPAKRLARPSTTARAMLGIGVNRKRGKKKRIPDLTKAITFMSGRLANARNQTLRQSRCIAGTFCPIMTKPTKKQPVRASLAASLIKYHCHKLFLKNEIRHSYY